MRNRSPYKTAEILRAEKTAVRLFGAKGMSHEAGIRSENVVAILIAFIELSRKRGPTVAEFKGALNEAA